MDSFFPTKVLTGGASSATRGPPQGGPHQDRPPALGLVQALSPLIPSGPSTHSIPGPSAPVRFLSVQVQKYRQAMQREMAKEGDSEGDEYMWSSSSTASSGSESADGIDEDAEVPVPSSLQGGGPPSRPWSTGAGCRGGGGLLSPSS